MRLESIRLLNFRMHRDLKVAFGQGFNAIAGVNGSGKTSLLNGVCEALKGFANHFDFPPGHIPPLSDAGAVRIALEQVGSSRRFETRFPVSIEASGIAFANECDWSITKSNQLEAGVVTGQTPALNWVQLRAVEDAVDLPPTAILPVVAFYRADRHWLQMKPDEMQAAVRRNSRTDGYIDWFNASLSSSSLQEWVVAKSLERLQTSAETAVTFEDIVDDELALVNQALAAAVEHAKGLRYDIKQKSLLMDWQSLNGSDVEPTAFENLSDGQRVVIGLVADIARRMCLLNPALARDSTRLTPGVVLIDELEMHLHPRWQRLITRGLTAAFPNVQFIVATHSPQILGELRPEQIILLRPEGPVHPQVSYGMDSSRVLEEIMDADARTPEVERDLSKLFMTLERNDLDEARRQLASLRERSPGIPELSGAEALLRRKEILGR